jgi:hypothetical protein|tara:strand:- start:48 stop:545 length:498 start_codon:yes stop_codon:yes gene_type:complete
MITFKQYLAEEAIIEANIKDYVKDSDVFLKKLAIAAGVTTAELSKSTAKFLVKPNNLLLLPFILSYYWFPKTTITLTVGLLKTILLLFGIYGDAATKVVNTLGIGVISAGALTIALWGKRTGTKIVKSWEMLIKKENIPAIKMDKVADDKKSVDAFVKTAQGKKV